MALMKILIMIIDINEVNIKYNGHPLQFLHNLNIYIYVYV